jgi:hypothetical protein
MTINEIKKIETLTVYMLSQLPVDYDTSEGSTNRRLFKAIAAGIVKAEVMDEKKTVNKVIESFDSKNMLKSVAFRP